MPLYNWDRVQSLFISVVDLPPEEQARLLDSSCLDDRELRAEVESLLESDRKRGQGIVSAVEGEATLLVDGQALIGDRLGSYRVVKEIGRGGMGSVYLAVRDDDQYQKQVAIKVVKRGMDTAETLLRFRHERQILANLDHPYIARLLDGGATSDGRPFFVMDFVAGQPLDVFCREQKLDVAARCQLFLRILEAVAHAHRNLVVHRDLKPGNIFVTSDGTPRLLDFGVAKLLSSDSVAGVTTTLARPFTPEYASPEQVRGLPVTTATDVYSLGAVFYELLTDRRAQPIVTHTPAEVDRVVCDTEAPRPSLVARNLDSDLDNIVLMAMRKDPARRYQSVDQFAEDIHRHLGGRPVVARQDSFWYRARKFLQRHRFETAAAVVVFASLVTGLFVSVSQSRQAEAARRAAEAEKTVAERERSGAEAARAAESVERRIADQQRDEAVRERARAEQRLTQLLSLADKTLFDIHDSIARLAGATEARRELVKTTLDYLENIEKASGLDDRMRLVLSAAYTKIAAIQGEPNRPSMGGFEDARKSYLKAEILLAPLYARKKDDPDVIFRWIGIESALADLTYRHFHRQEGIEAYLKLLPIAHKLAVRLPARQALKQEGDLHMGLALALLATDPPASLEHANAQVAIVTELVRRFPDDFDLRQDLGAALASAASSLKDVGDFKRSAEYFERSIRMREQLLQARPQDMAVQRNLLVVYGNYATLLGIPWSPNLGRFAEARAYCQKSVAIARRLVSADPDDKTARYDLGMSLARLGMVEPDPENVADSLRSLEEALRILDPIAKANPSSSSITSQVAMAREFTGYRLRTLGQPDAAAEHFRRALADLESMMKANPGQLIGVPRAVANEEALAQYYAAKGERVTALDYANHAIGRAEKYAGASPGKDTPQGYLANAYFALASVERTLGDWDRAGAAAEHAVSIWRTLKHPGAIALHKQAYERAEGLLREAARRPHSAQPLDSK